MKFVFVYNGLQAKVKHLPFFSLKLEYRHTFEPGVALQYPVWNHVGKHKVY